MWIVYKCYNMWSMFVYFVMFWSLSPPFRVVGPVIPHAARVSLSFLEGLGSVCLHMSLNWPVVLWTIVIAPCGKNQSSVFFLQCISLFPVIKYSVFKCILFFVWPNIFDSDIWRTMPFWSDRSLYFSLELNLQIWVSERNKILSPSSCVLKH